MVTEAKKYHPSKFTRVVLYPLFFILFLSVLGLILVFANGYNLTFENNRPVFQKTGMIIVNSRPIDAEIFMNGKSIGKKTSFTFLPVKFKVAPIEHVVTVSKEGFRTWEKKIKVKPNLVTWLNYVLLFPQDLKLAEVDSLKDKTIISQNKSKRFLLVSGIEDSINSLFIYDLSSGNMSQVWPKTYIPTEEWLKQPEIVSAEFNQNNDNILLRVKNGTGFDYAIMNAGREGKITSLAPLGIKPDKIAWSATEANDIYYLEKNSLHRLNINDLKISASIATGVIDFTTERNRKIYAVVSKSDNYNLVQMSMDGQLEETIAQSVIKDTNYKISRSSEGAVSLLPTNDRTLNVYYRLNGKVSTIQLSKDIKDFKWSADGQSIFYQNDTKIKKFDWVKEEETIADIGSKITSTDWYYDESHYLVNTENGLFVIDYDNTNKIEFLDKKAGAFYLDPRLSSFIFIDESGKNIKYDSTF